MEQGPWPFTTRIRTLKGGVGLRVLESRLHRKHLQRVHRREHWLRRSLTSFDNINWWIGVLFALGSALFMLGSALVIFPGTAANWSLNEQAVNGIFFLGSLPFTTAAYLQLYQSANAEHFARAGTGDSAGRVCFGWRPRDIGWLSCALQFVGTLLFNVNTFDAMLPNLDWWEQDLDIWVPNFAGSIFFLASGYLAYIEVCHAHIGWRPDRGCGSRHPHTVSHVHTGRRYLLPGGRAASAIRSSCVRHGLVTGLRLQLGRVIPLT